MVGYPEATVNLRPGPPATLASGISSVELANSDGCRPPQPWALEENGLFIASPSEGHALFPDPSAAFFPQYAKFFLILRPIRRVPRQEMKFVGVRTPTFSQLWP